MVYKSNAKSSIGVIRGIIIKLIKDGKEGKVQYSPRELQTIFEEALRQFDATEKVARVELKGWKNKSSLQIIEKQDGFDVVTFQKYDQDSEPREIIRNISLKEVNQVIQSIRNCSDNIDKKTGEKYCKTRDIALGYSIIAGINSNKEGYALFDNECNFNWQNYFGCRYLHTQLNTILRLLDYYKVIKYRGGRSYILKKDMQLELK